MNAKQKPANIDHNIAEGNPFHNGLTILSRIISRVYRRDLLISRLYIPSYGAQSYIEWPLISVNGAPVLVPATWCY